MANDVIFDADGRYVLKRRFEYVNAYNRWIHSYALCSNGDLKVLTNGAGTKDVVWYITSYATKSQSKTNNLAAMLDVITDRHSSTTEPLPASADKLLFRLCMQLNSKQEISSSMARASMEG